MGRSSTTNKPGLVVSNMVDYVDPPKWHCVMIPESQLFYVFSEVQWPTFCGLYIGVSATNGGVCLLLKKGLCSTDWAWERCLVCSSCQVDFTGVLRFACWLMLIVAVRVGLETYSWNFLNSSFCWCCSSCHRCRCCGGCFRLCWLLVACFFLSGLSRGASTAGFCADLSWKPMWWQNR